ncbi:MAG TPA: HEAT repeat domain-containing protein [Flexilinea sp.]|jgi:HEAT repeat protein|nr:HEAT repeat domain-containing protein [Flexilinea sp.]HOR56860.1 HEAT repeat domain-containing protein [Flexilinea sp.]HOU20232.1 HEAT repeat domain-containing protein [Flexilinea sp.]HQG88316.1 HEAT repeat domain-containing protein [Flexilinea sp.]HQJ01210.1 HEAT repeat domain-containing protein [Flexilinea sp.]
MKQEKNNQNKKNKFSDILSELRENNRELTYKEIQSFSDLSEENLAQFRQTWNLLSNKRKEMFFELLLVEFMSNTLMDFSEIALIGLNDEDPIIRRGSLKLLMDNRKSYFLDRLISISKQDPDTEVRLDAISTLGYFLMDTDTAERGKNKAEKVLKTLESLMESPDKMTRLRVMEALAYVDHPSIIPLVYASLTSDIDTEIASGLRAVQNSLNRRWAANVIENLDHPNPDVQYEAIKAVGELQLKRARNRILSLLARFDQLDDDILDATILTASQLGGNQVKEMIEMIEEIFEDEEDMAELFEEAKSNLELVDFQKQMAGNPDLKDLFTEESDEESENVEEDYIQILRERIENLPECEESEDKFEEIEEENEEEEDEDESDYPNRHSHRHSSFSDIDWSHFRIIEDLRKESEDLEDEDFSDLDEFEEDED